MSTPPKEDIWTLTRNKISGGGEQLAGCHIKFTGIAFEFTEPDPKKVLASTPGPLSPTASTPPFSFPVFSYQDQEWAITLWELPVDGDGHGAWATPGKKAADAHPPSRGKGTPQTDPQSGDFTAMNGGSADLEKATYRAKA